MRVHRLSHFQCVRYILMLYAHSLLCCIVRTSVELITCHVICSYLNECLLEFLSLLHLFDPSTLVRISLIKITMLFCLGLIRVYFSSESI